MRILYMSCHEILEYDELKLFSELGHEVYSLGAYTQPGGTEHRKRPPLELPYDPHFIELALQYDRRKLHPEMLDGFDVVIVMHTPGFLGYVGKHDWNPELGEGNWPLFRDFIRKGGRVIWRSIGQSVPSLEKKLQSFRNEGLEVVRYSPAEERIADNIGTDAVIRFYKDPDEYKDWNGQTRRVVNFTQSLKARAEFTGYKTIQHVMEDRPEGEAVVYGPGNEDLGALSGGLVTYEQQLQILRDSRVFIYTGTYPASYTLSFIEAMMTGIPIVAVGPKLGNGSMFPSLETYEVADIIEDGRSGLVDDDPALLRHHVTRLLNDYSAARLMSTFGRARAIELFGKERIKKQWQEFLER